MSTQESTGASSRRGDAPAGIRAAVDAAVAAASGSPTTSAWGGARGGTVIGMAESAPSSASATASAQASPGIRRDVSGADRPRDPAATSRLLLASGALALAFAVLYHAVIPKLVSDWATYANYSHGFLIVPIALYVAWQRREALSVAERRPAALGLVVVIGSIATLVAGILGAELFLSRISMVGVVAGTVLYVFGWSHLRILRFPIGFLLLMIPIPTLIFNEIAFPLQLLASRFGEAMLAVCAIPAVREGNIIVLSNTTLEVAEACSGIRSLMSLLTLGLVYGWFTDSRTAVRATIALLTIPIAIVTNGLRVAGTGVAAHYYGPEAATGFFHEFSGSVMFVAALGILLLVTRVVLLISPAPVVRSLARAA